MVTMEYVVKPNEQIPFMAAMTELAEIDRRDGAYSWGVYEDDSFPGTYIETFYLESWIEHLRQYEHITKPDKEVENKVHQNHQGKDRPRAKHFLAPKVPGISEEEG